MRFGNAQSVGIGNSVLATLLVFMAALVATLAIIAPLGSPLLLCTKITRGKAMYLMNFVDSSLWGCEPPWPPDLSTFVACENAHDRPALCSSVRGFATQGSSRGLVHRMCDYDKTVRQCNLSKYSNEVDLSQFSKRVQGVGP